MKPLYDNLKQFLYTKLERQSFETYRYAFNGKELDKPGMGGGQSTYDYGFRIYNPAIAKFLSVDPLTKEYPWYTPYQFAGNKPIWAIDLDGLEEFIRTQWFVPTFDAAGMPTGVQLWKTTIMVVKGKDVGNQNQMVHESIAVVDINGNINGSYIGTTTGTWNDSNLLNLNAGSSVFSAQENALIWQDAQAVNTAGVPLPPNQRDITQPNVTTGRIETQAVDYYPEKNVKKGSVQPSKPFGMIELFTPGVATPANLMDYPSGLNFTPPNPNDRFDLSATDKAPDITPTNNRTSPGGVRLTCITDPLRASLQSSPTSDDPQGTMSRAPVTDPMILVAPNGQTITSTFRK